MTSRRPYRARPYPAVISVTKLPKAEAPRTVCHNEGIYLSFNSSSCIHSIYYIAGVARYDCEMPDQHGLTEVANQHGQTASQ